MRKSKSTLSLALTCIVLLGCNSDVTLFNQSFMNLFTGSEVPIVPGPDSGYIMVLGLNDTSMGVEFIVTAEQEEIIVHLDNGGEISGYEARIMDPVTVNLVTDGNSPSLGIVFDNSPVSFPNSAPNNFTFNEVQDMINQLLTKDPEAVAGRDFVRLVRVTRIGLGPNLDVPSGTDDGIVVREPGQDPSTTAGVVYPSGVNNPISYSVGDNSADFGNGDIIIFLSLDSSSSVGGITVTAGVIDGDAASALDADYIRDTFEILRREQGPINPNPPS